MAVKAAGIARSQYRTRRSRQRFLVIFTVVILAVVLVAVAHAAIQSRAAKKTASNTIPGQVVSLAVRQAADINLVAGAVGQYVAANNALPARLSTAADGGLVLCGTTCDADTDTVDGLSVYEASNIQLMVYAPDLAVPNEQTMYLVPGAKCGDNGHLGALNTTPHSMVILYSQTTSVTTTPRCLVL